jgi:integrase
VPDKTLFPGKHQPVLPYIFSVKDIQRLLAEAEKLHPTGNSPLRPENMRLAVLILFTTGIRRGELVRLVLGDYDDTEKTLLIQASKFHKSRLVPISPSTARELEDFLDKRRIAGAPGASESPLLWNRCDGGRGYTGAGLAQGLRNLFRRVGIHRQDGRLPRVHDLRHAFAANALLRWYQDGVDIGAK